MQLFMDLKLGFEDLDIDSGPVMKRNFGLDCVDSCTFVEGW